MEEFCSRGRVGGGKVRLGSRWFWVTVVGIYLEILYGGGFFGAFVEYRAF